MEDRELQRQQSIARIALMLSLILHLSLLLILRGTVFLRAVSEVSDSILVHLINVRNPVIEPTKYIPKREFEPTRRTLTRPREVPDRRISAEKPPERETVRFSNKNLSKAEIPRVHTSAPMSSSLPSLLTSSESTTGASGASSQEKGTGSRSGGSRGGVGSIVSVPPPRVPVTDSSISEKFQVYSEADLPFVKALQEIAQHVVNVKSSRKVDIVFIIDKSESMQDDIDAVRRHLDRMIDRLRAAEMDFTLGVISFHHSMVYEWLGMDIKISPQTPDVEEIRKILRSMKVSGGERALDALMEAIEQVKFRPGADRHFILITDEYVSGTYPVDEVLRAAKRSRITIDVLGRDEPFQRTIAEQTGGIWTPIQSIR
jgi:Mg-chelatase subunit ChlD